MDLSGPTAWGLGSFFQPGSFVPGNTGGNYGLSPFSAGGIPTSASNNPLVAPLSAGAMNLTNLAGTMGQPNPLLQSASGFLGGVLNPNYASGLATSPQTMQAVQAAVNPLVNAFNQTTIPGLKGQFTASGQRIGNAESNPGTPGTSPTQKGSSAFDMAANQAQNNLLTQVGQTAAGIENQAYQTGLAQQMQAVQQAQSISSTEVQNLVSSLQAAALPQMIQQYGINAGVQLFQSQMENILKALGLSSVASQPAVGYFQQGSGSSSSTGGIIPGLGNMLGFQGIGQGLGNWLFSGTGSKVP